MAAALRGDCGTSEPCTGHLYVIIAGDRPYVDHVNFRNYLRLHTEVADQYAALKRKLAEVSGDDQQGYTDAKNEFVARVLDEGRRGV